MGVSSLVRFATAHCVGARCIFLVSHSLVPTGCICVVLVDLMTLGLAIVPRERFVCQATSPRSQCHRWRHAAFVLS
jgi:hypothetical protein